MPLGSWIEGISGGDDGSVISVPESSLGLLSMRRLGAGSTEASSFSLSESSSIKKPDLDVRARGLGLGWGLGRFATGGEELGG